MTEDEARQRVIRSMCPEKVCRTCGEPSRRIIEARYEADTEHRVANRGSLIGRTTWGRGEANPKENRLRSAPITVGWTDCGHDDWRPGVWLDPFKPEAT